MNVHADAGSVNVDARSWSSITIMFVHDHSRIVGMLDAL